MKKSSVLLAAAMLCGTSSAYAQTDIYPGMSDDEIMAVLEERDLLSEKEVPANIEKEDAVLSNNTSSLQQVLPAYVNVNNANPVYTRGACTPPPNPSHTVTGRDMGLYMPFPVTASTNRDPTGMMVPWVAAGPPNLKMGVAVGDGWMLMVKGDTFTNDWWLITQAGVIVYDIKIDAWNQAGGNNKHAVFDIVKNPHVTPGSARGWPFDPSFGWIPPFTATYSTPVLGTPSDLYGVLTLDFTTNAATGFSGAAPLGGLLMFRSDTDCMPVREVNIDDYDGTTLTFTVVGEGSVAIVEEAPDRSLTSVSGSFEVARGRGEETFSIGFSPQSGYCYSMMDEDTLATVPMNIDGESQDNYCF